MARQGLGDEARTGQKDLGKFSGFFVCFFFSFVFFTPKLLVIESYLNIFCNLYFFSVEPKDLVSTSWSNITNIFSHRERHASPQGEKL